MILYELLSAGLTAQLSGSFSVSGALWVINSINCFWLNCVHTELNKVQNLPGSAASLWFEKIHKNPIKSKCLHVRLKQDCVSVLLNSWHLGDLSPNSEDIFAFNTNTDVCCPCWTQMCWEIALFSFSVWSRRSN